MAGGHCWAEQQCEISSLSQWHPNHRAQWCVHLPDRKGRACTPGSCPPLPKVSHNGGKEFCPQGSWGLQRWEKVPSGPKYTRALSPRLHCSFAARPHRGLCRNTGGCLWVFTTTFCAMLSNGILKIAVG